MFIRKKQNKTGSVSVQVIDKTTGKYKVKRTIGSSNNAEQVLILVDQAKNYIEKTIGQQELNFSEWDDHHFYKTVYESIEQIQLLGPELVLGKIFDQVGFNQIKDDIFRHLVITRLVYPTSKLKTIDYLFKYKGIVYEKDKIYRYLDKLHKEQIQQVQQVSYRHTLKVLNNELSVVFYDVTTLYFESEDEDDLRKAEFSKDGKHKNPQIVLGLLVSFNGYPLDYEIFEGNTYEGYTMLPIVEVFKNKYKLNHLVVVADAGLMSNNNIIQLVENNYEFIIGARIKNESEVIKQQILDLKLDDGQSVVVPKEERLRLIIGYSASRAKNDEYNRKRGLTKLERALDKGKLSKRHLNNKGYNKYLKLEGEIKITIDYDKFNADSRWDGLKGYLTNSKLTKEEVIEHYKQLWTIEKTFRISKTDLRIRPIYHYRKRRIESHICIAFAACKIYKELERQLKEKKSPLSPEKVIDILKTIYGIHLIMPQSKQKRLMLLDKTKEQKALLKLFNLM